MREFATPMAFRAAVEARLRERARRLTAPAYIVRRQAALERLLVRLTIVAPGRWALKGGFAVEARLGDRARVSLDLDADHVRGAVAAREELQTAATTDVGDYFDFTLAGSEELSDAGVSLAMRFRLESSLAGRPFEPVQVDVTLAAPERWDAGAAQRPSILAELGFAAIIVPLVPLERQVAEKLHAYTRTYRGQGTTRVRDVIDLLLIYQHGRVDASALGDAIRRTFASRGTHPLPSRLPPPPADLAISYRRETQRVDVPSSLAEAHAMLTIWLDPILRQLAVDAEGPGR